MKTNLVIFLLFTFSIAFSQHFNNPKSIVYDSFNKRYIISNEGDTAENGFLLSLNPKTLSLSNFVASGLITPRGLCIYNNIVYTTDITSIKGYNLNTGYQVMNINIPGAIFLDGICVSGNGVLYATDNLSDLIFKVRISDQYISNFPWNLEINKPAGIYFDSDSSRLLITSKRPGSPIQSIKISSGQISLLTNTSFNDIDGITRDNAGNYYVASNVDSTVLKFDDHFANAPYEINNGITGPAGIFYNLLNDTLAIADYDADTVVFIYIPSTSIKNDDEGIAFNVFPNPVHDYFYLKFDTKKEKHITISLYSITGVKIKVLLDNQHVYGMQNFYFKISGLNLPDGHYFLNILYDNQLFSKKILKIDNDIN